MGVDVGNLYVSIQQGDYLLALWGFLLLILGVANACGGIDNLTVDKVDNVAEKISRTWPQRSPVVNSTILLVMADLRYELRRYKLVRAISPWVAGSAYSGILLVRIANSNFSAIEDTPIEIVDLVLRGTCVFATIVLAYAVYRWPALRRAEIGLSMI